MPRASQSFLPRHYPGSQSVADPQASRRPYMLLQMLVAYALIEAAIWTRPGALDVFWIVASAIWILAAVFAGDFSTRGMGLEIPPAKGSAWILLSAVVLTALIPAASSFLGTNAGPAHALPLDIAWRYAIWSLVQQFILQSFFFLRLEALLGSEWAVPAAAALFGVVHIPSPVLTVLAFFGGLFFCEMFRRYRNIFPLGVAHALFGLTVAASFSESLLHHMRVGIGYWMFGA